MLSYPDVAPRPSNLAHFQKVLAASSALGLRLPLGLPMNSRARSPPRVQPHAIADFRREADSPRLAR